MPTLKPSRTERQARVATSALFLTNGAVLANILPRYPEIKDVLDLGNSAYGWAVIAFPLGAVISGLAAAPLIRRMGSGRLAVVGTILTGLGVLAAGLAPSIVLFVTGLFFAGAMDAITDVAQNQQGLAVQRRYGRSILNSFHAIWSVGAVLGGAMAALAIALRIPLGLHLGISAVAMSLVALTASRYCLLDDNAETEDYEIASRGGGTETALSLRTCLIMAALVFIACAGAVTEDVGNSWATLYLRTLGAAPALAATGFIVLVGSQFLGRILGDRMVDRCGQRRVARLGGIIMATGMGLALVWPSVPTTLVGFACAGFGVATLVPAAMQRANDLSGLRTGTGLTVVSWLMRIGFLISPPVIGMVADATSLRTGLSIIPVVGMMVVALAGVLQARNVR